MKAPSTSQAVSTQRTRQSPSLLLLATSGRVDETAVRRGGTPGGCGAHQAAAPAATTTAAALGPRRATPRGCRVGDPGTRGASDGHERCLRAFALANGRSETSLGALIQSTPSFLPTICCSGMHTAGGMRGMRAGRRVRPERSGPRAPALA
jgi:hypothetical protein